MGDAGVKVRVTFNSPSPLILLCRGLSLMLQVTRRSAIVFLLNGLVMLVLIGQMTTGVAHAATTQPAEKGADQLPEVSVDLLGPLSRVKGLKWPHGYDHVRNNPDQPQLMATVDKPHEIVVHLPEGRTLRHISKLTFITQYEGKVIVVDLIPHMNLLPFQQGVVELENLLKEWDAVPKDRTKEDMARWKNYGNMKTGPNALSIPGGAILHGEGKADLFFKIRPGDGGWFLSISIGATAGVIDSLHAPASQPAAKPDANDD